MANPPVALHAMRFPETCLRCVFLARHNVAGGHFRLFVCLVIFSPSAFGVSDNQGQHCLLSGKICYITSVIHYIEVEPLEEPQDNRGIVFFYQVLCAV
ncbi:unnamed protein product [Arctogadus glacialis]